MKTIRFSAHALTEMERRGIGRHVAEEVVLKPEQIVEGRPGRQVFQGRLRDPDSAREYLIRVVIEQRLGNPYVITVYKTSKIGKSWRVVAV